MSGPERGTAFVERLTARRPVPDPGGAAPSPADLERILAAATTVPDHGRLRPWRFVVVEGAGRDRLARALVAGLTELRGPDQSGAAVAKMDKKAYAAPCAVLVVASPDPGASVAVWEQVASAACTAYALVLAATGLGYGAVWKSAAVLGTGPVRELAGCGPDEQLLGWVYLGTPPAGRTARRAPAGDPLEGRVTRLGG